MIRYIFLYLLYIKIKLIFLRIIINFLYKHDFSVFYFLPKTRMIKGNAQLEI